ncbi:hypothetical protein MAFF212519_28540 [Clavibacter michiganensis]
MGEEAGLRSRRGRLVRPAGSAPPAAAAGSVSIAITTLNRAEYCVKLLTDIGEKPDVAALLDHVYVTDQGTQKVADQPAFPRRRSCSARSSASSTRPTSADPAASPAACTRR